MRSTVPTYNVHHKPDYGFRVLVTVLFFVAFWLLAMPWFPGIARITMQRFHLQTDSFAAWAIQQPIPPMYSFANRAEVRTTSPSPWNEDSKPLVDVTVNHFPTRMFTFANARVRYLSDPTSRWFVLRSAYRGQSIKSVYRLDPKLPQGWNVTLESRDPS